MVRWLDPHQLLDTAVRVLLSGLLGTYADPRQLQALTDIEIHDRSQGAELWLDYVADLGDGWDSTYTVARFLASDDLDLGEEGEAGHTERGRLLVMGGDQVYPVPKRKEYENRLLGPYRAAMPCSNGEPPELFAIPGTHDWYDGLINFEEIFCRRRRIGGWQTQQSRSYFAVKLPHDWWLWGIDIQFGPYLDDEQWKYFSDVAEERLAQGDRIILCLSKEVAGGGDIFSDRDLGQLERRLIESAGARVMLYLRSGRHHYVRYQEEDGPRQHITAGGGGAFLHPTHQLPECLELPGQEGEVTYRRVQSYPSPEMSKRLRKRVWLLPLYNLPLAALIGMAQVLLAFNLGLHLRDRHRELGLTGLRQALWESPTAFLLIVLMLVLLAAMVRFAHDAPGVTRWLLGLVHSSLQLATTAGVLLAASRIVSGTGLEGAASLMVFLGLVALLGGACGALGMSGYLWATNCLGFHGNEAYAPLHHEDQKNFLRLHIDAEGALTVYPVGVERVGRKWRPTPDAPAHAPWFEPDGPEPEAALIDGPVRIDR
ncbi:MAG: metallophosphoesterase [Actinomycetota bacterium]|nr:metallophosphoesterase [Actinomycetota bacterium]